MPLYEHVFIARQDASAAQVEGMVEAFSGIVEQSGGRITKKENWGLKTMAYRIKKNRKGHYVLLNIDAPSETVQELERNQRLHEDVLRYMTIRVDVHEEGPSIMMQGKRDRDSRRAERMRSEDSAPRDPARKDEQVQEAPPAEPISGGEDQPDAGAEKESEQ
ncbi:MAG: 30S ribosomal protein S6 [Alphaproteobacteria bacterium]